MAHQAELVDTVPATLPDDFDHWDSDGAPPATLPNDFDNFDDAPAPQVSSSAPRAVAAPALSNVAETPVHTMPAPAHIAPPAPKRTQESPRMRGPAVVPQPADSNTLAIHEVTAAAPARQSANHVTIEELSSLVQAYHATVDEESYGKKQHKKNLVIRWIVACVLVLAIVAAVVVLRPHEPAERSQGVVVVQHPIVTDTPDATPLKEKPSPSKPAQPATETSVPAPQP